MDEEDEIDIRQIFSVLMQYKKSIIAITLLVAAFAMVRAYFSPTVYRADSLLKISKEMHNYGTILNTELYPELSDAENELAIFSSHMIADRVLERMNIGIRYYTHRFLKKEELYKDSPFIVMVKYLTPDLYGTEFKVIPLNDKQFRLLLEVPEYIKTIEKIKSYLIPSDTDIDEKTQFFEYDEIHNYSEKIETEWFVLTLQKITELKNKPYQFTVMPNMMMASFIQGGVSASTTVKTGNIISLSFTDTVPLRAKELLGNIVKAYIDSYVDYKTESAKKQLGFLDMQLQAIDKTLNGSAEKLQQYKATNIVVDLSSKASLTASKLSNYESKLYEIDMQINILEGILNHLAHEEDLYALTVDYPQSAGPVIGTLLKELGIEIVNYKALLSGYTERHPRVLLVKKKILSLKRSLKDALDGTLRSLKERKEGILKIIDEEKKTMKNFSVQEQELGQLTRTFKVNEKIYSFLLEKRAEVAIEKASVISNTRILDKVNVEGPVGPKRKLIVLVGFILGFILGIAQAFLRAFLDNTVKSADDIEHLTDIPIYGILPLFKSKKSRSYYREALRALWINIAFMKSDTKSKIISITSTIPGEGKSLTIAKLVETIAKSSDKNIIVLDLDMRKSTLHKHFNLDNYKGVSTLLDNKCTLSEAIQKTQYDNLKVISSGPKISNPTKLIMSIMLESMIADLSKQYDYIFLDTPPIGIVSDATKILHMSQLTLFVVRANLSKKEYIKEINKLSKQADLNPGIILNGVNIEKSYGYDYKSSYMDTYLEDR